MRKFTGFLILCAIVAGVAGVVLHFGSFAYFPGTPRWIIAVPVAFAVVLIVFASRLLGPHFYWETIRLSRKDRTILVRALYILSLLVCLYWSYGLFLRPRTLTLGMIWQPVIEGNEMARFAESFVVAILWMQMLAVLILTPAYLAGAIAEEREKNSLDLLLTTHLSDREIVLGKLFGRLVHLAALVLASFPVLALTQFFGGVSMGVLLIDLAILGFTLLLVGSVSILVSTLSRTVWEAVLATYAIVIVMVLFSGSMFLKTGRGNLLRALISVEDPSGTIWELVVSHVSASLLLLAGAILALRKYERRFQGARDKLAGALGMQSARSEDGWPAARLWQAKAVPVPALFGEPLFWKEMFFGRRVHMRDFWVGFLLLVSFLIIPFLLYFLRPFYLRSDDVGDPYRRQINLARVVVTVLAGFYFLGVGFRAAGSVVRERQRRTLDSLLCLPGDRTTVLVAKWWASLLRPSFASYAAGMVLILGFLVWALYPKAAPFLVLMLLAHVAFAASLGLFVSIVAPTRAWANFVFALVLFLLSVPALFVHFFLPPAPPDLVTNVVKVGLNPVAGWWFWTSNWETDIEIQGLQSAGSVIGTMLFTAAAYALWRAARWRFDVGLRK